MDFIERLFNISPDAGSGSLEFLLLMIPVVAIGYWAIRKRHSVR